MQETISHSPKALQVDSGGDHEDAERKNVTTCRRLLRRRQKSRTSARHREVLPSVIRNLFTCEAAVHGGTHFRSCTAISNSVVMIGGVSLDLSKTLLAPALSASSTTAGRKALV